MATIAERTAPDQLLDPLAECFTVEVAQRIVDLEINPTVQARLNSLADKANHGSLTPSEQLEYEDFVEAIDELTLVQAQARSVLSKLGS